MARYWVNLGAEPEETEEPKYKRLQKELEGLANHVSGDFLAQFSFVTESLSEAKEVVDEAKKLYEKYGFDPEECNVNIVRQPECPNCHLYGRFSDEYCPKCGDKMIPKEYIEV
jgi:hypothetical protein